MAALVAMVSVGVFGFGSPATSSQNEERPDAVHGHYKGVRLIGTAGRAAPNWKAGNVRQWTKSKVITLDVAHWENEPTGRFLLKIGSSHVRGVSKRVSAKQFDLQPVQMSEAGKPKPRWANGQVNHWTITVVEGGYILKSQASDASDTDPFAGDFLFRKSTVR